MDIGISDEWMGGMGDHFHCRHLHEYMKKRLEEEEEGPLLLPLKQRPDEGMSGMGDGHLHCGHLYGCRKKRQREGRDHLSLHQCP